MQHYPVSILTNMIINVKFLNMEDVVGTRITIKLKKNAMELVGKVIYGCIVSKFDSFSHLIFI